MTWQPDDTELDEVARSLETAEPTHARAEEVRTSILAGAATQRQLSRRSLAPVAIAGAALAAAAVVAIWLAARPTDTRESIRAVGGAKFEGVSTWPDYVVRLDDGTIA